MVFSSTVFLLLFLPVVLVVYYNPFFKSRGFKNTILFASSILFYAWGEPLFVFVMLLSIFLNWLAVLRLSHSSDKKKKFILILSVIYNLGLLFVFKYLGFVCENLSLVFNRDLMSKTIALPIGISFFTFQMMSYVFDVYYGKAKAQKRLLDVGLYISMFPQLIAGPIVRYETVANEIQYRKENLNDFAMGVCRFIIGLSKKVILANNVAKLSDLAFANSPDVSTLLAWLGAIAYTLQIYFDFSGYSDMAIGLGQMFGFHFPENFNYPYISKSITEFWRRWHISLSSWFRDYLYFPLGGSRSTELRNYFNLFVVWLCTGIWHGANWTFILWGLMYFVLIAFERKTGLAKTETPSPALGTLRVIYTLIFVVVGWVLFKSNSIAAATVYLGNMVGVKSNGFADAATMRLLGDNALLLFVSAISCTPLIKLIPNSFKSSRLYEMLFFISHALLLVVSISIIINGSYNPFIYFNF